MEYASTQIQTSINTVVQKREDAQFLLPVTLLLVSFFFIVTKDYKAIRSNLVILFITKFILKKNFTVSLDHIVKCEPKNSEANMSLFFTKSF